MTARNQDRSFPADAHWDARVWVAPFQLSRATSICQSESTAPLGNEAESGVDTQDAWSVSDRQ